MKILIGYDGSSYSDIAIDDLKWAGLPQKADAMVLSAAEWPTIQALRSWGMVETDFTPEWMERIEKANDLAATGALRLQRIFPEWNIELESSGGNPAEAILDKAKEWSADLIVVGTHGRSTLGRAVLGSVSMKLIKEAPCSVRVARSSQHDGTTRLLIGVDGSTEADAAVTEVCGRAWPSVTEAKILAVHEVMVPVGDERIAVGDKVYDQINEDERFRLRETGQTAAGRLGRAGLVTRFVFEEGDPRHALVRQARDFHPDCIFVGARGLTRAEGLLLGSVSAAIVAHAPCSVEVVRHR